MNQVVGPRISVIILSWNRREDTLAAIQSVSIQDESCVEVIVVDAGSSDESPRYIEERFPDVKLIRLTKNLGVPGNRNVGIAAATGEFLFFLDNDAELATGSLTRVLEAFDNWPLLGAVGGRVTDFDTGKIDPLFWVYPHAQGRWSDHSFLTHTFAGGAVALRKAAVERVGGFWEELFFAREEEDLGLRLLDAGYEIAYVPSIEVLHKASLTQRVSSREKLKLDLRNMLWITWRYFPALALVRLSLQRICLYLIRATRMGRLDAALMGLVEALRGLPSVISLRAPISKDTFRRYVELNPRARIVPFGYPQLLPSGGLVERSEFEANERVDLLGVEVDRISKPTLLGRVAKAISERSGTMHIVTLNLDILVSALEDETYRDILNCASFVVADGVPLIWYSRALRAPIPERINGTDLVWDLARASAATGISLFILGSTRDVVAQAQQKLEERHPGVTIAGSYQPPIGPWPSTEDERIAAEILVAKPDVLLVALGAPRQEQWIADWAPQMQVPVAVGIGGSLDIISGRFRRAPVWAQRAGLEWLFRLVQDPIRLTRRYLVRDSRVALHLARRHLIRR